MDRICIKIEPLDIFDDCITYDGIAGVSSNTLNEDIETGSCNSFKPSEIEHSEDTREMHFDPLEEFYFDSDHIALKNNIDYKELLKAIAVLEAQKANAIRDLDKLHELKEKALADPIGFVERLQQGEKINFPAPQNIYPVPVIDLNKYTFNSSSSFNRRQLTRLSTRATQDLFKNSTKEKPCRSQDQKPKVNQYWTAEEQKQLEELLVKFPPEEIESRRWEKIANCLENRTPIQVASRVQKYFIKLLKAGIPIPGRMPNIAYLKKPRRNVIRNQPSTFLVSHTLPVYMPDAEEELNYSYSQPQISEENSMESKLEMSDEEEFDPDLQETPEYKELIFLRKIQRQKLQNYGLTENISFKDSHCKTEPNIGTQWHCTEYKSPLSIDFYAKRADE